MKIGTTFGNQTLSRKLPSIRIHVLAIITVLSLFVLLTMAPPAASASPGLTRSVGLSANLPSIVVVLNSTTCTSDFQGSWTSPTCTITPASDRNGPTLPSGETLYIPKGTTLSISSSSCCDAFINDGTIHNYGTITISNIPFSGDGFDNFGTLVNHGVLEINNAEGGEGQNGFVNDGTVTNLGSLLINNSVSSEFGPDGLGFNNGGTLTNYGAMNLSNTGNVGLFSSGTFKNYGSFRVSNNGFLNVDCSVCHIDGFENHGTAMNRGSMTVSNYMGIGIANYATFTNYHTLVTNTTDPNGYGFYNSVGGTINNHGTLKILNGGVESGFANHGTVNDYGSILNFGTFLNYNALTISNSLPFSIGLDNLHGGNFRDEAGATTTVKNSGFHTIGILNSGAIANDPGSTFTIDSGALMINHGTFTNELGSTFTNNGTFKGNPPVV